MQRVCQECVRIYGEKCGCCGDAEPHVTYNRPGEPREFKCANPRCGHKWTEGQDHQSHGICDTCSIKVLASLRNVTPSVAPRWHPEKNYGR